jgi:glycosyltransferase involved in cell wall biosynthesis
MCLISIIIPIYNKSQYIIEALKSCISQSYQNIEIILIDDCSTDNSLEKASTYLENTIVQYRILKQTRNKGVSAARNRGIKEAKGEYIIFLDADDIFHRHSLSILHNIAFAKDADVIYPRQGSYDEVLNLKSLNYSIENANFLQEPPMSAICCLIKKKIIIDNNIVFEESINNGEDTLFAAELMGVTDKTYYIDIPLYGYRKNVKGSLSNGAWNNPEREIPRELSQLEAAQNHMFNLVQRRALGEEIRFIRKKKNAIRVMCYNNKIVIDANTRKALHKRCHMKDLYHADMTLSTKMFEILMLFPGLDTEIIFYILYKFKEILQ